MSEEDLIAASERVREHIARRKAAERPYALPGLDVVWWHPKPPLQVWAHRGVSCAIGVGGQPGVNGYVLLPASHPWQRPGFNTNEIDAPGGITFGPHLTGWMGFDTGHAGDRWADAELEPYVSQLDTDTLARWVYLRELNSKYPDPRFPWSHDWTVAEVISETNALADQVVDADPSRGKEDA